MTDTIEEIEDWEAFLDQEHKEQGWPVRSIIPDEERKEWINRQPRWWYKMPWHEPRRARRVRDKQRMKRRAEWVALNKWGYRSHDQVKEYGAVRFADNIKVCSCWRCGNRRLHEGPNMQERRELAKTEDMMRRSPHLLGPLPVNPAMEINRRLQRRIQQMLRRQK